MSDNRIDSLPCEQAIGRSFYVDLFQALGVALLLVSSVFVVVSFLLLPVPGI